MLPKNIGEYEIIGEIYEGERCRILKALDEHHTQLVLKCLKTEERENFYRDWRIMYQLSQEPIFKNIVPNVFRGVHYDEKTATTYYAMELLGENMYSLLKDINVEEALLLMRDISELLAVAHDYKQEKPIPINGITHGNIDLSHIVKSKHSRDWKLISFRYNPALQYLDEPEKCRYNPYIIPPEFNETKKIDFSTDIFQLGATFYTIITKKKIIFHDLKMPSKVANTPKLIDGIFEKVLNDDPQKRGTMKELNATLSEIIGAYKKEKRSIYIKSPESMIDSVKYLINSGNIEEGLSQLDELSLLYPKSIEGALFILDYIIENSDKDKLNRVVDGLSLKTSKIDEEKRDKLLLKLFRAYTSLFLERAENNENTIKNFIKQFSHEDVSPELSFRIKTEIADLLLFLGYYRESISIYTHLLKYGFLSETDISHIKNNAGISCLLVGEVNEARELFDEKKNFKQLNNLGVTEALLNRFVESENYLKDSKEMCHSNESWKILSNLAVTAYYQRNFGEAINYALESTELMPYANNADGVILSIRNNIKNEALEKRINEIKDSCQIDFAKKTSMLLHKKEFKKILYLLPSKLE